MQATVLLSALVLVPALLILWWRAHGPLTFMSVCLGYVLMTFVSSDVTDFLTSFLGANKLFTTQWVKIGLLAAVVLLTLLFTVRSVKKNKLLFNFVPAVGAGMLLALFLVPLLPTAAQKLFTATDLWDTLRNLQADVLLGGGAFSMLYFFVASREHSEEEGKKGKHK